MAKLYVRKCAPGLNDFLSEQGALNRIPDKRRARLVLDIADEMGADGDLTQFRDVFHCVRMVRNAIALAAQMERIDADTLRLSKGITYKRAGSDATVPRTQIGRLLLLSPYGYPTIDTSSVTHNFESGLGFHET